MGNSKIIIFNYIITIDRNILPVYFHCVPSMALILLVKVQSRVFTAKCSEPQADASNGMGEGSGVAKFLSLRTETCGARMKVVNFIISKDLLENRIKDGAGLLNPLSYYLVKVGI